MSKNVGRAKNQVRDASTKVVKQLFKISLFKKANIMKTRIFPKTKHELIGHTRPNKGFYIPKLNFS